MNSKMKRKMMKNETTRKKTKRNWTEKQKGCAPKRTEKSLIRKIFYLNE